MKAVKYNITFNRNGVYQSNLAIAECTASVWAWYKMYKPDAKILDVTPARSDDEKPGKPCIQIDANYMPYMLAAENMNFILRREKGMTCAFYVMDKRYYNDLACPEFSADNRGNQLIIGDWYVIVTCSNGYKYYINVTCDSVITMCAEVFNFIQNK